MDAATVLALTISNNHARYFNEEKKLVIESNEQIIKVVNSNILKLIMRNQMIKLKKIDHRNMPDNLTNLDTILAQYKNPEINEYEEENDDTSFAEIKTDDDNKVIKIVLLPGTLTKKNQLEIF